MQAEWDWLLRREVRHPSPLPRSADLAGCDQFLHREPDRGRVGPDLGCDVLAAPPGVASHVVEQALGQVAPALLRRC